MTVPATETITVDLEKGLLMLEFKAANVEATSRTTMDLASAQAFIARLQRGVNALMAAAGQQGGTHETR